MIIQTEGLSDYDTDKDLFEHLDQLPKEVLDIFDTVVECNTYQQCDELLAKLEPLGYTFDYYLNAEPYNLRRISETDN